MADPIDSHPQGLRTFKRSFSNRFVFLISTVLTIVVTSAVLLAVAGFEPIQVLRAFWLGSVGSAYALSSATLVRAVPLILTGLAVALAFRTGVFNIGAEGQFLAGATLAAIVGLELYPLVGRAALLPALLAGAVAGILWAGIAAWLRARFHVLEVISTIMLNFIALYLVGFLVRGPLQEQSRVFPQSDAVAEAMHLPKLLPNTRLHIGLLIALGFAIALWWVLRHTTIGFRIRAVGANADAAAVAGQINVVRTTVLAFTTSGALAGLAGAIELTGVTFSLYENLSPGYGYTAIAVALLARLDPLAIIGSGVFFGALQAGGTAMQRDAGVPSGLVVVIEAAIILAVIVFEQRRYIRRMAT